jgi:hypothetical protein
MEGRPGFHGMVGLTGERTLAALFFVVSVHMTVLSLVYPRRNSAGIWETGHSLEDGRKMFHFVCEGADRRGSFSARGYPTK